MSKSRIIKTNGHNRFEPNTLPRTVGYRSAQPIGYWWQNVQKRPMWTLWQADMMTIDYQVAIGLAISDAPLYAAEVEVESDYPAVAEFVGKQWDRIWSSHAWQILLAKRFGFMGYEVNYVERNGLIEFDSLNDFHPRDTRPVIDEHGLFVGINVYGRRYIGTDEGVGVAALRGPKCLWIRYDYRNNDFFGRSCLEKAYAPWWDKTMDGGALNLRRLRNVKDSWIGDVVKVPFTRTMVADDGVTQINLADIAQRIVENRVSGGVMVLPSERDEKGDPLCEYTGPTSVTSSTGIDDWIHDLDNDILDGLLIPREVMEAATSGSGYSGRAFPMRTFLSLRDREFSEYVRAINRAIIGPMVASNFGLPFSVYEMRPVSLNETLKDSVQPAQQPAQMPQQRPETGETIQFSADSENPKANSINQRMTGVAVGFQSEIQSAIRGLLKKNARTQA